MSENREKISFTLDDELGGGGVPSEVQLLPSGEVNPKGKAAFTVDEESRGLITDAFDTGRGELVIDYEHQSLSGSEAPAAGWIRGLTDRGEAGVWGTVEWTERAIKYITEREYRYLSPVVLVRKSDGRAVELLGAALTNLPAIGGMAPVANKDTGPEDVDGYSEGAYRRIYHVVLKTIGLPEDAGFDEVAARLTDLTVPLDTVPRSEYEALALKLKQNEADALVSGAVTDGRLTPALMPWARAYALSDPAGFREFVSRSAGVIPFGKGAGGGDNRPSVGAGQRVMNGLLGLSDEHYTRFGRADGLG